ncbi:MAG: SEL1-like repeat protein [Kiritimatiellae bacterium]|nr:SEL1-like repeat protein [Kiritimatiellia bacterium]
MTLEEQRKMLGADGDIERDCEDIARKAAQLILDRTENTPSIADMLGEESEFKDEERQEIEKAIALEREVEINGDPYKMCELADWIEVCTFFEDDEEKCRLMLHWYAEAALGGAPAGMSAIGRAFDGWYGDAELFDSEDDEDDDEFLIQDDLIGSACELAAAKRGDSYGLLQWFSYYLGWNLEKPCEKNFDKAMDCLVQLVERSRVVNAGRIRRDIWAYQGARKLEDLVKKAPPQNEWDDCEYPYIFGLCHEKGWVLEKDLEKALAYYRMAAGFGHERSKSAAKRVQEEVAERR